MRTLSPAQKSLIALLRVYQKTLSPDSGWFSCRYPYGVCRFYPHCSEYAIQAITQLGTLRGTARAVRRVVRCHPWQAGGVDLVRE